MVDTQSIVEYSKKTTDSNYPIQQRIVSSYIDSLLNSTSVLALRREGFHSNNFEDDYANEFVLLKLLSEDAALFQSNENDNNHLQKSRIASIIAYSMKRKDMTLFEMISEVFFTGDVELHSSDNIISKTDEGGYTDSNIYTDGDDYIPTVYYHNYYHDFVRWGENHAPKWVNDEYHVRMWLETLYNETGMRFQSIDELQKELTDAKKLISIVKPARVAIRFLDIPVVHIGASGRSGAGFCFGGEMIESNPFDKEMYLREHSQFLTKHESKGMYKYLESNVSNISVCSHSQYDYRTFYVFETTIMMTRDVSDIKDDKLIWGDVTLYGYPYLSEIEPEWRLPIKFRISSAKRQDGCATYYAKIIIRLPKV